MGKSECKKQKIQETKKDFTPFVKMNRAEKKYNAQKTFNTRNCTKGCTCAFGNSTLGNLRTGSFVKVHVSTVFKNNLWASSRKILEMNKKCTFI